MHAHVNSWAALHLHSKPSTMLARKHKHFEFLILIGYFIVSQCHFDITFEIIRRITLTKFIGLTIVLDNLALAIHNPIEVG